MTDFQRAAQHPAAYRQVLRIETDEGYRPLSDVLDDWQREDFRALDESWRAAAGHPDAEPQYQRAWLERPRGHSKTSDLAISATWPLLFGRRPISGVAVASDRDQAKLLRDCISRLAHANQWVAKALEVGNWKVTNKVTNSALEIMSSDVGSSYGILPDFIVMDEVVHWPRRELFDSLLSSGAKREHCLVLCISNAGFSDSWQYELRENIRANSNWYFSRLDGPQASWMTDDRLEEQRALLPDVAFRRLWQNEWTSGAGDAISEDDIAAATDDSLGPMRGDEKGWSFIAGLDIGIKRDASALCVLAYNSGYNKRTNKAIIDDWGKRRPVYTKVRGSGELRLAACHVWKPTRGQRIELEAIEQALQAAQKRYKLDAVLYDPWQAEHLQQRLSKLGLNMREFTFSGTNLQDLATTVLEAFSNRAISLYPNEQLLRELRRLQVVEKSYGFRLESPRDEFGHGDLATAFMLGTKGAVEAAENPKRDLREYLDAGFF